jgi:ABC-type proline/glycine betaine transport system permease subunit
MPRRAPTEIVEQRITFGNYERQFVTEVKNDIEKGVKIATITAVAIPVATVAGLGLLGYGIYRGMNSWAFGNALDTAGSLAKVQLVLLNKILNPFAWINDL